MYAKAAEAEEGVLMVTTVTSTPGEGPREREAGRAEGPVRRKTREVRAVDEISFSIEPGRRVPGERRGQDIDAQISGLVYPHHGARLGLIPSKAAGS